MFEFACRDQHILPHLLCDISFSCEEGDGIVIVGENGIGKSSLIHFLFKKYQPSYDLSLMDQNRLDPFYDRTLGAIKSLVRKPLKNLFDLERFESLWNLFHFELKAERSLSQLSGGEMQSLKLILALSRKASIYFLDEPFHSLDLEKKNILIRLIEKLRFEKKIIILIEHQLIFFGSNWRVLHLENIDKTLRQKN